MRFIGIVLALAFVSALAVAEDNQARPLTPAEAAKKVNEKCTVEMQVKNVGKGKGVYFLNSKKDFKAADNFTVFINNVGVARLREAKIDDPITYYKDKTIRVTGVVKLYRERPELVVEKADQIQVVEKK